MNIPDLATLIGAYYHQDFDTVWGALAEYLALANSDEMDGVLRDIETVLASCPDDDSVREVLDSLGNAANLRGTPGGYRGWLEEIALRIRAHLGE